jgi:peptidyl-prolyl cis-trans isomerase C
MKTSFFKLSVMVFAAIILFTSCDRDRDQGPDVLVTVNDDPVRTRDLQISWSALSEEERQEYLGPQGVRKLLDELITWKLMAQEAEKRRLDEDPAVKERIELFKQRMLVNALLDRAVSDADIFRYFQENFIRCSFIFLKFPENASNKQKSKVKSRTEAIYEELKQGADFGELARTRSEAANAAGGGDMGYVTHSTLSNMVDFKTAEAVFSLKKPGAFTRPMQVEDGYCIYQLLEPQGNLNPAGLSQELRNALRERKREEVIRSFANELNSRPDNEIVYNERALRAFLENVRQAWEDSDSGTGIEPGGTSSPEVPAPPADNQGE